MGQSTPLLRKPGTEAFRSAVLDGAEMLTRDQIRALADELHHLARLMTSASGMGAPIHEDGRTVWI